ALDRRSWRGVPPADESHAYMVQVLSRFGWSSTEKTSHRPSNWAPNTWCVSSGRRSTVVRWVPRIQTRARSPGIVESTNNEPSPVATACTTSDSSSRWLIRPASSAWRHDAGRSTRQKPVATEPGCPGVHPEAHTRTTSNVVASRLPDVATPTVDHRDVIRVVPVRVRGDAAGPGDARRTVHRVSICGTGSVVGVPEDGVVMEDLDVGM